MLLGGTTTFTDMYYFEDVVAEVAKEAGMRGVLGETIIGFPVADNKTPADALQFTERYLVRFRNDPLVVAAVAPHALYTNSYETLKASRALANKYHAPLIIHLSETKKENDDAMAKRHMSPTRVLDSLGVWNGRSLAAHGVWLDEADMGILKARGVGVAHCPSSNMKLASGVARWSACCKWAFPSDSAPTAPPAAITISTCSRKWTSPPNCRKSAPATRRHFPPPRRSKWPPSAAHAHWGWKKKSARSKPANAPT